MFLARSVNLCLSTALVFCMAMTVLSEKKICRVFEPRSHQGNFVATWTTSHGHTGDATLPPSTMLDTIGNGLWFSEEIKLRNQQLHPIRFSKSVLSSEGRGWKNSLGYWKYQCKDANQNTLTNTHSLSCAVFQWNKQHRFYMSSVKSFQNTSPKHLSVCGGGKCFAWRYSNWKASKLDETSVEMKRPVIQNTRYDNMTTKYIVQSKTINTTTKHRIYI